MTPATADQVAELYGVGRTTVYRWVDNGMFAEDVITRMKSPSGERDRVLFDREATAIQFENEMIHEPVKLPAGVLKARTQAVEDFRNG